jgi:glycosyltransferase involved in cell wall biosynthesis
MTSRPTVTVVIPCYNQGHFLPAAIDSVRAQTFERERLQLIVVDDGSTDDTAQIADRLGAAVIEQANRGLSTARNAGLRAAAGEFVVFLDADDELLPDAIATGMARFEERPALACILRYCLLIDEDGSPLPTRPPEIERRDIYAELLHRNVTWAPGAAMFRSTDVIDAGGFPSDVSATGDYSLYLRFARQGRLAYFHQPAVRYRQHGLNMSRDPAVMLQSTLTVLAAERHRVPPSLRREWIAGRREWCRFYGDQIVDEMRREWRDERRPHALARALVTLVRLCPGVALTHAGRKLSRLARGLPSAALDAPDRFTTASGRPRDTGR